ncbi:hypothetical protein ACFU7Y_36150 [Kitasatospora sp. NPDC057542]|uniref:hypothetical protein n=1 Tax=Kitasatospora sp. NPDC057542 TaxID=3346162 RepID=UPI003678D887
MKITTTVENPTPDALEQLLALAATPAAVVAVVPDDRWTPERARAYYDRLPPRAQQILLQVVEGDGECPADQLRAEGRSLRGSTGAFRRVLSEGARTGVWPEALLMPLTSHIVGGQLRKVEMPGYGTERYAHPAFEEGLHDLLFRR